MEPTTDPPPAAEPFAAGLDGTCFYCGRPIETVDDLDVCDSCYEDYERE